MDSGENAAFKPSCEKMRLSEQAGEFYFYLAFSCPHVFNA